MILLPIDPKSNTPLYRQIIQGIMDLIENHTLEAGDQLPSTRQLSASLGINRTTIYWAYQELLALGYLDSCPGSYTTVRKRAPIVTAKQIVKRSRIPWNKISNPSSQLVIKNYVNKYLEPEIFTSPDVINLSRLYIEEQLFPIQDFQRCLNNVLVNDGAKLFGYGEAAGYQPLRECVAHRLQSHGITVSGHEILITHGAQQTFELILKLLTNPGAGVVIEMPTYANIISLLQYYQTSIIEIPMLEYGMDLDHLKNVLEQKHPAFIYTMPNFHNPTGVTTSQAHR
jgi:DNA-binding transcriptional MocR family regulator